jgi:hypothetical protein
MKKISLNIMWRFLWIHEFGRWTIAMNFLYAEKYLQTNFGFRQLLTFILNQFGGYYQKK